MRIGLICPYDIWRGGGVQECVLAMQQELSKRGHEVKVITPLPRNYDGVVEDHIIVLGKSAAMRSLATSNEISASIKIDAIKDMLAKEKFDILHFHEPWMPLLSRQILSRSSSINVATFHAKLPETVMAKTVEKVITPYVKSIQKYLDVLSAVSPAAAEYLSIIEPDAQITIIPNGIDLKKYHVTSNKKQDRGDKTILYIGRLEKRKGVKYLLKAFRELAKTEKNIQLVIAGRGPDMEKLQQWVQTQGVPRVKFLGFVSDAQKIKLLNDADVFCSPALYGESFGIVLLEAMAMGVPTVAGNNSGYSGVLKEQSISLIDPKDIHAFAERLRLFMHDQNLRDSWQKWALEHVKQFDYPKVIDQYEDLYKKALSK